MSFFKKRWVAVVLCVLMIVAALAISKPTTYQPESTASASQWGQENYESYTRYIHDEAGLLPDSTIKTVSRYNAASDYSYGCICGLVVLDDGKLELEEAAHDYADLLGLGSNDYLLVLDEADEDWYFAYGDNASYYVNNELEVIVKSAVNKAFSKPDKAMDELYEELADWYEDALPVAEQRPDSEHTVSVVGGSAIVIFLIIVLVLVAVFSALARVGRRWFGGWGPTIFVGRPWHHHRHHPPRPPHEPRPGPRPGPGPRPSSGPRPGGSPGHRSSPGAGGFGGGSRGSFGKGGGFGGSSRGGGGSRGGGFGGRR